MTTILTHVRWCVATPMLLIGLGVMLVGSAVIECGVVIGGENSPKKRRQS